MKEKILPQHEMRREELNNSPALLKTSPTFLARIKTIGIQLALAVTVMICSCSPTPHHPELKMSYSDPPNRGQNPLTPRVPSHLTDVARRFVSPYYVSSREASPEIVAQGKSLYESKGTCFNCHGWDGTGNGPASQMVSPEPRDFSDCQFHNHRTDGELYWVMKHGSPGTDMVAMIPSPLSEEEAWKVLAYVRTFCPGWREGN